MRVVRTRQFLVQMQMLMPLQILDSSRWQIKWATETFAHNKILTRSKTGQLISMDSFPCNPILSMASKLWCSLLCSPIKGKRVKFLVCSLARSFHIKLRMSIKQMKCKCSWLVKAVRSVVRLLVRNRGACPTQWWLTLPSLGSAVPR